MNSKEAIALIAEINSKEDDRYQMLHIRIPKVLHRKWKSYTKANKLSQQQVFELMLRDFLDDYKEEA